LHATYVIVHFTNVLNAQGSMLEHIFLAILINVGPK
jgi:hypothetical protein